MLKVEHLTDKTVKGKKTTKEKKICTVCARDSEKLYQNNTCKACLVKSFRRIIPFIDHHRDLKRHNK